MIIFPKQYWCSIGIMVFIISVLFVSCKKQQETTPKVEETAKNSVELNEEEFQLANIVMGTVQERSLGGRIKVNGILDTPPQNIVTISPRLGGYIQSLTILQGQHVHKGDILAKIEHQDVITLQEEYLTGKAKFEQVSAEYQRQQSLSKERISSGSALELARADFLSLKAKTLALTERLKLLGIQPETLEQKGIQSSYSIVSPINGYITTVRANNGKFIAPNDVVCEIVDTKHLHAELTVFETDIPKINEGQHVNFTLIHEQNERKGTVFLIGKEISKERTVRVHVHLDKEDVYLRPGTYLTAFINVEQKTVSAVPDEAIVNFDGKHYIFYAEHHNPEESSELSNGKPHHTFTMKEVQIGIKEGGFTEIRSGDKISLQALTIVVKGAYSLLSKMKNSEEEE